MTALTQEEARIIGGVDTHADTIHVAAIDTLGRALGDRECPTTPAGYSDALAFLGAFGVVICLGVEGTSSYGAGLTSAARSAGFEVREVIRPERSVRRLQGKSDPIDALQAARAVLSGRAEVSPKDEEIEALRALHNARKSAVKARIAAMNQIHQMLVTSPVDVREKYRQLAGEKLVTALASCRPSAKSGIGGVVLTALKCLAQRHQFLTAQAENLLVQIRNTVAAANPTLLSAKGVGPATAAQLLITAGGNPERLRSEASFAALCGDRAGPRVIGEDHSLPAIAWW